MNATDTKTANANIVSAKPKVLLIEPDRRLAESYAYALDHAGFHVTACAGARTAIIVADEIKPDLVILEVQLVKHSGIEFLYEFRSYPDWQDTPVIINTFVDPASLTESADLIKNSLNVAKILYKPDATLKNLINSACEAVPVKA